MTTFTRRNAWNNNGTFDNPDLYWYAAGVREMQNRSLDDPTSWWFYAAIHGSDWSGATLPANVPDKPAPSAALKGQYWGQCQHSTWFFPPWHRGYLYAIENVLRKIIKELGGPDDWALPYWNYFGPGGQHIMPSAFAKQTMPDGSSNPLYIKARYGPKGDGNVYIDLSQVSQKCQEAISYTGSQPQSYGGGVTGFIHYGGRPGGLEYNPHNGVHNQVGGKIQGSYGLMSDAETAGLDPIFYLHHCNIDRMWAAWNANGKNNPEDPDWNNGPVATKDRKFYMPKPDNSAWEFTPAMVNNTNQLNYTYEELSLGVPQPLMTKNALRLVNFGLPLNAIKNIDDMEQDENTELIGANGGSIALDATGARTTVKLDSKGLKTVAKSIKTFSALSSENITGFNLPDEVFLELEGIRGNADANIYSVTVNQHFVGHVFLFGLRKASQKDGEHGGGGLNIAFDITKIIDQLHLSDKDVTELNSLDIVIQPTGPVYENEKCTIERVSIYRKGQV
jgi:tyrosinase